MHTKEYGIDNIYCCLHDKNEISWDPTAQMSVQTDLYRCQLNTRPRLSVTGWWHMESRLSVTGWWHMASTGYHQWLGDDTWRLQVIISDWVMTHGVYRLPSVTGDGTWRLGYHQWLVMAHGVYRLSSVTGDGTWSLGYHQWLGDGTWRLGHHQWLGDGTWRLGYHQWLGDGTWSLQVIISDWVTAHGVYRSSSVTGWWHMASTGYHQWLGDDTWRLGHHQWLGDGTWRLQVIISDWVMTHGVYRLSSVTGWWHMESTGHHQWLGDDTWSLGYHQWLVMAHGV